MTSSGPTTADSVRLALPGEAESIAHLQRRFWAISLPEATAGTLLAGITVEEMAEVWSSAITRPPQARYRVLVAVQEHRVVGFATTVPSPDPDARPGKDGLVEEFVIDPPAQRRGHGSRLMHACVDTMRADGFSRATWWAASTDDPLRRFLTEAGWAPDGGWREIGTDDESVKLRQIRMHSDITANG
ncbi:MAG TPA: GNAT family N-acetyltransferase [Propionibacteriaceae bacterium]